MPATPRRALLVMAHPRADSLTAQTTTRAREQLEHNGFTVDLIDLHAEGFDPRMTPEDEPDWANREKKYSAEVHTHMRRIETADTIVVIFPIWWFGMPALLKGWVDRVWNYGFGYGRSQPRLAGKRILWIGLAGESAEYFAKEGMDEVIDRQLRVGISNYCGIEDATVRLIHHTLPQGEPNHEQKVFTNTAAALNEFLAD